MKLVEIIIIR